MANTRITELTAKTAPISTDVLPIVDVTANETKKITYGDLLINVPLGSATSPSISFSGDQNTGIFSSAADTLNLSTNGVSRIALSTSALASTLPFRGQNGSATAPAISFSGDNNTGIYNITADTLGITTNGTERIRVTSVGNVKVGGSANRATTEGTNSVVIFDGTAPVGTLANGVSLYSTAGECRVMDAAGNATLLSPHDKVTNEWVYDSVDTRTGKHLRIDMEKMMRFINDHFGLDFIHEFSAD